MNEQLIKSINDFIEKKLINPDWGKIYGGDDKRYKELVDKLSVPKSPKIKPSSKQGR